MKSIEIYIEAPNLLSGLIKLCVLFPLFSSVFVQAIAKNIGETDEAIKSNRTDWRPINGRSLRGLIQVHSKSLRYEDLEFEALGEIVLDHESGQAGSSEKWKPQLEPIS